MRQTMGLLLAVLLLAGALPAAAESGVFAALPAGHWSYAAMRDLIQAGLVAGDIDRLQPEKTMSRYEMAILVANGRTRLPDADAAQTAALEKLAAEFAAELEQLGQTPAKQAAPKNKLNVMVEQRLQYNLTSLGANDGGRWPSGSINRKGQAAERLRLYLDAPIGDQWHFNARFFQQKLNWGADSGQSTAGDTNGRFDRFWLTGKDVLGGSLEVGKNYLYPGKGLFFGSLGDVEGVIYTAKTDKAKFHGGYAELDWVANGSAPAGNLQFAEVSYKPTATSDIGAYVLKHEFSPGLTDIDLFSVNGALELGNRQALSFEWARNNAAGADYHGKSGYIVAWQSHYRNTWRMPPVYDGAVNPFKKHDSAWAVSYRHMPVGDGQFNRGANSVAPLSADLSGGYQNTLNNIDAWRFDYYYVPWQNVGWALVYDRVKDRDGSWTNHSVQTAFIFLFK